MNTDKAVMALTIGDSVTWTHSSSNGNSIRFRTREGKIVLFEGEIATVKMRNGRISRLHVSHLRKEGEKTELTEVFMHGFNQNSRIVNSNA